MKKFKSLPFAFVVALLLLAAGPPRPAFAECTNATNMDYSVMVAVSTNIGSPTQLVTATGSPACVSILPLWSGSGTKPNSEFLLVQTSSFGFSSSASTGTARIPVGNSPSEIFQLGDYRGTLWAVAIGTTGAGVSLPQVTVIRKK